MEKLSLTTGLRLSSAIIEGLKERSEVQDRGFLLSNYPKSISVQKTRNRKYPVSKTVISTEEDGGSQASLLEPDQRGRATQKDPVESAMESKANSEC